MRGDSKSSRNFLLRQFGGEHPGREYVTDEEWLQIGRLLKLSTRERQVGRHLFEGKKRAVIANEMQLASGEPMSEDTVRVYIDRLYRKADVHSLTDFALRITRIVFSLRQEAAAAKKSGA